MKIRFLPYFFLSILTALGQVNTAHLTGTTGNVQTNIDARVLGSGTTGTVPKLTGTNTIGNSTLTESGTTVTASGNVTVTGNLTAKQGDLPSGLRAAGVGGGVQFGATAGSRAESVMTGQAVGTNDYTLAFRFRMPTSNPPVTQYVGALRDSSGNQVVYTISNSGVFQTIFQKTAETTITTTHSQISVALHGGQYVDIAIVRLGITNAFVYANGVLLSTGTIAAPAVGVSYSASTFYRVGDYIGSDVPLQSPISSARLFNRALSASDVLALSLYGVNAADEWGSMTPWYTQDSSAALTPWTATRATATANVDGVVGKDNVIRMVVDSSASTTHYVIWSAPLLSSKPGARHRITGSIYCPTANTSDGWRIAFGDAGGLATASGGKSGAWQTFNVETPATTGPNAVIYFTSGSNVNFTGNGTDELYFADLAFTQLGALADIDMATGAGGVLTDRSANRLDATLYGAWTHIAPVRESIIESGTLTASNPALSITQTWNNGAVTFDGLTYTLTDTASAAASRFANFLVGTSRKFSIGKDGSIDIWGTYTDTSNYRHLDILQTSGGAATIQSNGLGTGATANTLSIGVNTLSALDIAADGDVTANYDLNAASGNVLTRIRTQAGTAPAMLPSSTAGSRVEAVLARTTIGTGDLAIAARIEVQAATPSSDQFIATLREDVNNRISLTMVSGGFIRIDSVKTGVAVTSVTGASITSRYGGQVIDLVLTRVGTTQTLYINGVQFFTGTSTSLDISFAPTAQFIAGNMSSSSAPYQSRIYNTQLYTRALSAADCADLAQKGVNPADQWVDGSALYTSDFSAWADSWSWSRVAVAGNVDGIGGVDNTLRITSDSTAAATHAASKLSMTYGKRYKITGSVYIPSSNSLVNSASIVTASQFALITAIDAWTTFSTEQIFTGTQFWVYQAVNGSITFDGNGTDVIYLKNVTITPIGCALSWRYIGPGPTFADDSSNAYLGLGVGVSQTLPSSGGTYSYEARFLASAISASAGTTKLIDLPPNAGVMNVEILRNSAMDAAVTLDVGTSGTAAKYASAMAMDATGLLFADSLSKGSESATAITPLYIKKSGATTVGDITVRITIQARN